MKNKISDQPIRVLIIGPGPVQVGGVATFIQFLKRDISLNQRFSVLHMDTARKVEDLATAARFSFLNLTYFFRQVVRLFKILHTTRPQIVHLSVTAGWSFWKVVTFLLMSRAFKAKVVAHMHGGAFNLFFEHSNAIVKKLIAWSLNQADVVVALSEWWKKFYLERISRALNVLVIFNSPEESFPYIANVHSPNGCKGSTVLFVGSTGRRKGVFDILKAIPLVVQDFDSVQFVFLGDEEFSGEKQHIMDIVRETNLEGHVKFPGRVTGAEKYRYYQQADIFILPSHAENLPFSLLEAMAMGLPVITTPVGGIPEIVDDDRNGYLIQPGDEKELAARIVLLLENPQTRERMGACNSKKIQEKFQPETIARQWEMLYLQLLVQRRVDLLITDQEISQWTK